MTNRHEINTVGIVGLGLIGGSIAKAIKETEKYKILAYDIKSEIVQEAMDEAVVDSPLDDNELKNCQLLIIALYPTETINFIKTKQEFIKAGTLVVDCCGTKRKVCQESEPIALKNGFYFIGGHPMAGIEYSGYENSKADLFKGAPMILCADYQRVKEKNDSDYSELDMAANFFKELGFGRIVFTMAEEHDRLIAYTSQLAHVVSNAFVKSKTAEKHQGFSAGSYQDLTRVARLNANMWTELFFENRDYLSAEIDGLIKNLQQYKAALVGDKKSELHRLLKEGSKRKESIDK